MEKLGHQRLTCLLVAWSTLLVQIFFIHAADCSQHNGGISRNETRQELALAGGVVMSNGIISVTLSNPAGMVTGIQYNGINNVLETINKEDDRGSRISSYPEWLEFWLVSRLTGHLAGRLERKLIVTDDKMTTAVDKYCIGRQDGFPGDRLMYWDVVWAKLGANIIYSKLLGKSLKVIVQNDNQVEISFIKTWNNDGVPLNVDKRFIMLQDSAGFYSYGIFDRPNGMPEVNIDQVRIVFKLQENKFHYMAILEQRQREMPMLEDRIRGVALDYPKAVRLTNPTNSLLKGEIRGRQVSILVKTKLIKFKVGFPTTQQ
ncbi:unnamed protein product [Camellia sinensis]